MQYKIGRNHVLLPAPVSRTFRKMLGMRVRAANVASNHAPQLPLQPLRPDRSLVTLMSQFVTQIGDWWTPTKEEVVSDADLLTIDELTTELQREMDEAAVSEQSAEPSVSELEKTGRPNIWKFLKHVPLEEIQKSRIMASLANATYYIPRIQFSSILERYGFRLVTTSLTCKESAASEKLVTEAVREGDGMAVGKSEIPKPTGKKTKNTESNIVSATSLLDQTAQQDDPTGWRGPFNVGTVAGTVYSHTLAHLARQVALAATVSHSAVTDTVTRVMKLLQAALRPREDLKTIATSEVESQPGTVPAKVASKCPTEWFVCDNEKKDTRFFCIQGSDSFESWQTNIKFDPVPLEDDSLGVRVHRGVYEAAQGLYGLLVPLVRDHLESGAGKKISFTGHSLGGAIASVLLVMMVHRGDLPIESVGQVFTFGGAASVSDNNDCTSCSLRSICDAPDKSHPRSEKGVLERLGLPANAVVNVIMHKDIVPRAFACDYSTVASLLRTWSSAFRRHKDLSIPGRATLYNFLGEVQVLQPDQGRRFVNGEGYHPMLPPMPGLFKLTDVDAESMKFKKQMMAEHKNEGQNIGYEADSKLAALLALLDNPHPLDILADPGAYGDKGSISRYHNPLNYCGGLRSIIELKTPGFTVFGIPLTPPQLPF